MTTQMTGLLALAAVCAMGLSWSSAGAAPRADFVVSPTGDDAAAGTAAKPFATLARARDAVRKRIAAGLKADVVVLVRSGTYRLTEPVSFGPADSPGKGHTVTYAAWPGDKPILSGGRVLKGFKAGPGPARRLAIGEAKGGQWAFGELYVDGVRRPRARHPNSGYARVAKVIDDRHSFQYVAGDLPELSPAGPAKLVLLHDWSVSRTPIKTLDAKTRTLTTAESIGGPHRFWRINGFEPRPRYFIENHPALLDAPGEWYLDAQSGVLTYRPMDGEKLAGVEVIAPVAKGLLAVRGEPGKPVMGLRFEGLTFEHCAWSPDGVRYAGGQACFHWARPAKKGGPWQPVAPAVVLEHAHRCRLTGCTIRRVGGSGVWLAGGCHDNTLSRCRISDVAGNGVMIGPGRGAKEPNLSAGNTLTDSVVERCGVLYYGAVGVWVGLSGQNTIAHNEIAHHPYTGVSVGWMWNPTPTACKANVVENNHIHHVMQILSDGGGIYTLGRQPGSVLRGNWIHDVPLNAGRAESNGMFLDEGTTDLVIEKNLIYNTIRSPLRFHKAGKNLVRNNHMALSKKGVPLVRYNATDSKNITLEANTVIPPAERDGAAFQAALAAAKKQTGPRP